MLETEDSYPLHWTQQPAWQRVLPPKKSDRECCMETKQMQIFLLPGRNMMRSQFRNAFAYEHKQAIMSNPAAFPCTDLPVTLLVLSPTPAQHCWEQQHHRYQRHQTTTGMYLDMVNMLWTWCWLNQMCSWRIFPADDSLLQLLPNQPRLRNFRMISSCCTHMSKQALQGSKAPRRDRQSAGIKRLLPVQCTSENQHRGLSQSVSKLFQTGNSCASITASEENCTTSTLRTKQYNL